MAKLYGEVLGARGTASRVGHTKIASHVRGWDTGLYSEVTAAKDGKTILRVWKTGGSNNATQRELVYESIT